MSLSAVRSAGYVAGVLLFVTQVVPPAAVMAATHAQIRELSNHLVNGIFHAKAGDVVELTSSPQNLELLEDLWVDLHKVGAWSIIRIHTDRMDRLFYQEVPAKFDSEQPANDLGLVRFITARINIDYESDPAIYDNVPPSRFAVTAKSDESVTQYMLAHNVPYIEVGNGLYPSKYTAQQYGISLDQLAGLFWNGVNANANDIQSKGRVIRSALGSATLVHVTAPNGTDLSFNALASSVIVNDGTISAAARRKGGAALNVSLPAGDITFLPEAGSARGTIVSGPQYYNSTKVVGLTLHLAAGKIATWTASTGSNVVAKFYETGGAGGDEFSYADIGANPNIHYIAGSALFASMAGGMVSFGAGNNLNYGGSNNSPLYLGAYVPNATVTIGGQVIVKNGTLTQRP